jgi:hypothetical protein
MFEKSTLGPVRPVLYLLLLLPRHGPMPCHAMPASYLRRIDLLVDRFQPPCTLVDRIQPACTLVDHAS